MHGVDVDSEHGSDAQIPDSQNATKNWRMYPPMGPGVSIEQRRGIMRREDPTLEELCAESEPTLVEFMRRDESTLEDSCAERNPY